MEIDITKRVKRLTKAANRRKAYLRANISAALENDDFVPKHLSSARAEYFKAGAVAAIKMVDTVIAKADLL